MTDDLEHSDLSGDISVTIDSENETPVDGITEGTASVDESTSEIADKWRTFMAEQDRQGERGASKWMVFFGTLVLFVLHANWTTR